MYVEDFRFDDVEDGRVGAYLLQFRENLLITSFFQVYFRCNYPF